MFHFLNPYYITASIHSSNNHAFREAGRVEDTLEDFESNTMERLRLDGLVSSSLVRLDMKTMLAVKDLW
jgi:hypothetical protein